MQMDFMEFLRTRFIVALILGVGTEFLWVWVAKYKAEASKVSSALNDMSMAGALVFVAIFFVLAFVAAKLYELAFGRRAEPETTAEAGAEAREEVAAGGSGPETRND